MWTQCGCGPNMDVQSTGSKCFSKGSHAREGTNLHCVEQYIVSTEKRKNWLKWKPLAKSVVK